MTARRWLDRTQEITNAATEGPWSFFEDTRLDGMPVYRIGSNETGEDIGSVPRYRHSDDGEREAEFIAHARTALPQAVAALRAVAELHQPDDGGHCTECLIGHDGDSFTAGKPVYDAWPCATIQAIQTAIGGHQ